MGARSGRCSGGSARRSDASSASRPRCAPNPQSWLGSDRTLRRLTCAGWSQGHPYWTEETLAALRARHPFGLHMAEYRAAMGDKELGRLYGELDDVRQRIAQATAARL